MNLTPIPQNYKKNVDWILGAYTDAGVSFPNGFQKDAIQNAAGARKNKKWIDWHCDISLIKNKKGTFVVIEDSGTYGLTGNNIPTDEVNAMMADEKTLPPEERLSRFTSMFNSGGNTEGAGLYGAGKSVYSVASNTYTYYFDSLRDDQKYVANVNMRGQVNPKALEGDVAKKFIKDKTGLKEKKNVGTRIIIESPKDELIKSIESGELIQYIQESWWLIISRLPLGASISVNGNPVLVPEDIKNATRIFEIGSPEQYIEGYKVKHFGLYVFEDGNNRWNGISYYRKGMKIGEVDIKDIPKKIEGKFWGYIEVDGSWEEGLSDIEDKVHFGVSKGKKNKAAYQHLKNYCNTRSNACFIEWDYIKDKENEDKKLRDELKAIAEDIQDLFDKLGFEDLGKGPQKSDFDVRWQDIVYPEKGTETVTTGDKIKFKIRIKSSYLTNKKFEYKLVVINPVTREIISKIEADTITVNSNSTTVREYEHIINKETSQQFSENRIELRVKVIGSGKEKIKELPYFYDIEKQENTKDVVNLNLHECIFPREGSRRVNFDESINKVCYRIENKRNYNLSYKLNISIHNANDTTFQKIVDVDSFEGVVAPFEDIITPTIEEIVFEKSLYEQFMDEGELELRAKLIANADDPLFEKGDKITSYKYRIYLNKDEKNGKNDSFDVKSVDAPEEYKRSWYIAGTGRTIILNIGHMAYTSLEEYPEIQHEYLREQMLKQYVLLYLAEGKYDMFKDEDKDFSELEPQESAELIIRKIEDVYYQSLR